MAGQPFFYDVCSVCLFITTKLLPMQVRNEFYKDVNGAIVVYDVTNQTSFNALDDWIAEFRKHMPNTQDIGTIPCVVCANKVTETEKRSYEITNCFRSIWINKEWSIRRERSGQKQEASPTLRHHAVRDKMSMKCLELQSHRLSMQWPKMAKHKMTLHNWDTHMNRSKRCVLLKAAQTTMKCQASKGEVASKALHLSAA